MPVPNRSRFASFALKTLTGAVASAVLMASAHAAGLGKLTGFSGTVAYITAAGLPLPAVGEIVGSLALLAAHLPVPRVLDGRPDRLSWTACHRGGRDLEVPAGGPR